MKVQNEIVEVIHYREAHPSERDNRILADGAARILTHNASVVAVVPTGKSAGRG